MCPKVVGEEDNVTGKREALEELGGVVKGVDDVDAIVAKPTGAQPGQQSIGRLRRHHDHVVAHLGGVFAIPPVLLDLDAAELDKPG